MARGGRLGALLPGVPLKIDVPVTAAVRALRAAGVAFEPRVYAYVERGGTRHSAEALGVDEHAVVKTLVMEARGREGRAQPLLVLMHGDREVSTKELARRIGAREVAPASARGGREAHRLRAGGREPVRDAVAPARLRRGLDPRRSRSF